MEKTGVIGVIIVLIIIAGIFFLYNKGGTNSQNVVTTTVTANKTNTTVAGSNTSVIKTTAVTTTQANQTNNTSVTLNSCIASSSSVNLTNGNFATGTYYGWNVTGNGFGTSPANIIAYNSNHEYYNSEWSNYSGQYFATTYKGGFVISPGNLTSNVFEVTEPYLNFKIITPQSNQLYVEILNSGVPVITKQFDSFGSSGSPSGTFEPVNIPLTTLLCKNVSVRVVSSVTYTPATKYDIIAVGDFYLSKTPA